MKKYILIGLIIVFGFVFVLPMLSSASISDIACQGSATDSAKISCLESRVSNLVNQLTALEVRINALESKGVPGTPIGVPGIPVPTPPTRVCPSGCTCSGDTIACPANNTTSGSTTSTNSGLTATSCPVGCTCLGDTVSCPATTSTETKAIQSFLKEEGSFTYPTATGNYGTITQSAVKQFQIKQGLTATGLIDQNTLQKMKELAPTLAPSANASLQQVVQ